MDNNRDYYSILQLHRNASQEDVERAYQRLSKLYDPTNSKKAQAEKRYQDVQDAYDTLSDKKRRADYDRSISRGRLPGSAMVDGAGGDGSIPRPYFLAGALGAAVIAVVIVIIVAVVASDGDDETVAAIDTPTPTAVGQTPAPTPEGQTPAATAAPAPPPVEGETVTTPTGLQYIDIAPGTGPAAVPGDELAVDYTGWLQSDNTMFDSSVGGSPFTLTLGAGEVITGWDEGLAGMQQGGMRRLIIPPDLAYGAQGQGQIPPDATLIFDVTLVTLIPAAQ